MAHKYSVSMHLKTDPFLFKIQHFPHPLTADGNFYFKTNRRPSKQVPGLLVPEHNRGSRAPRAQCTSEMARQRFKAQSPYTHVL